MKTDFQKAEEEGLTKLVYIPFYNQDTPFISLMREQPTNMIGILNDYIERLETKIGFIDHEFDPLSLPFRDLNNETDWGGWENKVKAISQKLEHNRLVHLKPKHILVDEESQVMLCCEYESKNLDKYIPPHVKIMFTGDISLIDNLRAGKVPVGGMWNLAPVYFVTPIFGRYENE